jgi:hypothetical protein
MLILWVVSRKLCVVHLRDIILPSNFPSTIDLCRTLYISFATRML